MSLTETAGNLRRSCSHFESCAVSSSDGRSHRTPDGFTELTNSIIVCGLGHDLCKANFYKVETRNAKNEAGEWVQVPYYTVDDQLPYGHGEKSVYILSRFIELTEAEAMAIRWHMGGFDDAVKGGSYALSRVFEKYPLALALHIADMQATYWDEVRGA